MSKPKIILAGSISIDRIMNFAGSYKDLIQPDKLHVLSISVLVDSLQRSHGGIGANIAYNLALLGEQPILFGAVGPNTEDYLNKLEKLGVDVTHVYHSELPTATFSTLTDKDDNQVGGFYPGAMSDSATLSLIPWKNKNVLAVISAHDPEAMRQQVAECTLHKIRYVYDIGQQASNLSAEDIIAGLDQAEILFANDYELGVISQKIKRSEAEIVKSLQICITTLGKAGCRIEGKRVGKAIEVPAMSGLKVVDPTGAGDAFRAGFLFGYVRAWSLEKCAKLGSIIASFAIEQRGTQEHNFSLADCQKRYQQTYKQVIKI
ncbi:MAG: carbohydrate kinase family protein [Candidatus Paceibacterota bacterium]